MKDIKIVCFYEGDGGIGISDMIVKDGDGVDEVSSELWEMYKIDDVEKEFDKLREGYNDSNWDDGLIDFDKNKKLFLERWNGEDLFSFGMEYVGYIGYVEENRIEELREVIKEIDSEEES